MELQLTWFVLVAVLFSSYAALDGFDLGVGVLYPIMGRNKGQKALLRASLGPLWDGNEVWLIAAAGALFAAFPTAWALALSDLYVPIALIPFGLVVRAVSVQLSARDESRCGFWDAGFFLGSLLPAALFGLALGNIVRGVPLDANGDYAGSLWDLLNPFALLVGFTGLVMLMVQGAAWAALRTEGQLQLKAGIARSGLHWLFLVCLAGLTLYSAFVVPEHMQHVLTRPTGWLSLALLVGGILGVRLCGHGPADTAAFLASSVTIIGLMGMAATGNYPVLVPARGTPPDTALTVANASASRYTLTVLLIIACICCPLLIAYTASVYRTFRGRIRPPATGY